ncbi:MAG: molybdopterin-guanine dinucleotide biosynthesis protein MobA [Betaproteobacteria bacterium SG8_39]|nr:MAG: molybdopterin-guanine dinucleotide biosynthesis protein MobA [Betaproteobacteria bacterium SG8_39]
MSAASAAPRRAIVGLLLAAGASRRFGADKLAHALPHGVVVAVQAARHLKAEVEHVVAVVRPGSEATAEALAAEGCDVVVCPDADQGMGASLACGARAAGEAAGYLVALADMPFVRPSTIAAVRDALAGGAALAAPYFRTRRGHPVGIAGRFRAELEALSDDEGARSLLAAHAAELVKVPVGDPGVIRDIDTPADVAPPPRV